jgi:hypothetical protein
MRTGDCLLLQNNILLKIPRLTATKILSIAACIFANRIETAKGLMPAKVYTEAIYMASTIAFCLQKNYSEPRLVKRQVSNSLFLKFELLIEAASAVSVARASCIPNYGMLKV